MAKIYLGIDLGTTGIKCLAADEKGRPLCTASRINTIDSPRSGWMEQRPDEWLDTAVDAIRECALKAGAEHIAAAAFSGHMSSPVFLDRENRPLYSCMTVGDSRCETQSRRLRENMEEAFLKRTGNRPLSCFVAAKILWFKENEPWKYKKMKCFVMAKDYLRYKMTGILNTDITDAGNTLLLDAKNGIWDQELIRKTGLREDIFPEIRQPEERVGKFLPEIADRCGIPRDTAVYCGGADMALSQLAAGSFNRGAAAITLSTSGQICMLAEEEKRAEGLGKVTFHPGIQKGRGYAMGSVFSGGLALNWCYKTLTGKTQMEQEDFARMNLLAEDAGRKEPGSSGILFLPFLTGSGSPYFCPKVRGTFLGVSANADQTAIFQSVLEGVSFHIRENAEILAGMGGEIKRIYLSGGGTRIRAWVQILTDIMGKEVHVLRTADVSTLGAALVALAGECQEKKLEELSEEALYMAEVRKPDQERAKQYDRLFRRYREYCKSIHELYGRLGS